MVRICRVVCTALLIASMSLLGVTVANERSSTSIPDKRAEAIAAAALWSAQLDPDFASVQCSSGDYHIRVRRLAFCKAPVIDPPVVAIDGDVFRYRVLVEKGLDATTNEFAKTADTILNAETGWTQAGLNFVQVESGEDFTIFLAQPRSVDRLCRPLTTEGTLSCAISGKAVINAERWFRGAETWDGNNIPGYRYYLINHEVGHLLGLGHTRCPEKGMPAPIMLPQTRFLKGCLPSGEISERDLKMIARVMPLLRRRLKMARPGRLLSKPTFSRKRRWYRKRRGRRRYARRRR